LIIGTTQYQWGWFSDSFWLELVYTFLLAFLHAIVYNQNRRSILAAVLLHFFANLTFGMLYPFDVQTIAIMAVLLFTVAAWLSWRYRQVPGIEPVGAL
jgi:membrane protease YdiL (CAAX protease family)